MSGNKQKILIDQIKSIIVDILKGKLTTNQIGNDVMLFGGGIDLDSIDLLELVPRIEKTTGVVIDRSKPGIFYSINTIAEYVLNSMEVKQ